MATGPVRSGQGHRVSTTAGARARASRAQRRCALRAPALSAPRHLPRPAAASPTRPPTCLPQSGVGGVVMGGTAIFSALNGYTPHMAGAIDIMVVEQPDGSLKCSPFYGARGVL